MNLSAEIRAQRKITAAFIATQPVEIALRPRTKVKKATGGYDWEEGDERDPQVLRLIEPPRPNDPVRTADGEQHDVEFILLGAHDAVIEEYDTFDHAGKPWTIVQIYHDNGWERRAAVARHG